MTDFVTPVGRLVYGSVFEGSDKGYQNRLNDIDQSTGKPQLKWTFGLAIEKGNPELPAFMALLQGSMREAWPTFQGNMSDPDSFKAKIIDGDSPKYVGKDAYKGCLVFKIESKFLPTVFAVDGNRLITNPEEVKRGYYIQVAGSYTTNALQDKPGMKLWGSKILFRYAGEELKGSGGDPSCFENTGGYRPAGAMDAQQQAPQQQGFNQQAPQQQGFNQQVNPNQPVDAQQQVAQAQQSTAQGGAYGATTSPSNQQAPAQDWNFLNQ